MNFVIEKMDMNFVIEKAKDILMETGYFVPSLFVEWDHTNALILAIPQSEEVDNAVDRAYLHFLSGRHMMHKLHKKKAFRKSAVTNVFRVTEVWTTMRKAGGTHLVRPRDDPNRKEALCISHLEVATSHESMVCYEMLRDGSGELVDLLFMEDSDTDNWIVSDPHLLSFVAGTRTAKQNMSQAIHEFRREIERYREKCASNHA